MNKKAIRIISVILLQTFIFYGTALGSVDTSQPIAQSPESKVLSIDTIGLPKDIGSVKSKYQGKNGKLIIHIQDAHCNYEAQGNISKILEIFSKDYNINTISVEGADGYIDTSWFKAFPDAEIRKEVADYFMKKGEITGAEFLSITSDYPIKLFGAENRNLYIKNLNAFTTTYPHKERIEKYLLGVKSILRRLKGYVYTKKLKEFDGKIEEYKDKEITLSDYAKILSLKLKRYNVNLKAYPNFSKLIYTLVYEDKIDFDTVDGERAALIDKLSKDLPKDELQELVLQSFSFKTGKLGPDEYYGYLRDITKAHSIDLAKDYPNLSNYVIYTKLYARIENENLFNELEDIKNSVKEKLFENDDQRDLSACWDNVNILIGLINIKLSNREFAYYASNRKKFNPDFFMNFVNSQVSRYNLAYSIEEPSEFIKTNLPKLEEFYEIATKRDRALVDNTLKTMKSEKTDAAILISGGFHTEGISDLLEKKGVSYVVVCPNITKDVESPYIQVLTNQKTPFEELLIESAAPRKDDSLLAPLVLSRLMLSDVREVKWFDKHITGLAKRLRGAKVNFTKRCVAHWIKKAPMLAREHNIPLDNDIFRESYIHALRQRATALNFAPDKANAIVELAEEELDELLTERYHPEGSFFTLDDVDVEGKTVGVRVDINLPEDQFENLVLIDRLPATAETIKEIADKGGKVVVFGHQGRKYKKNGEPNLNFEASMSGHAELFRYLIPEHEIIVVNDLFGNMAQEAIRNLQESQILFLNNVRDWDGEEKVSVDPAQSELVQNIEPLLDLYVIDGFSVSHRAQPSVVGFSRIPNVAGRLMQRELQGLEKVIENIEAPYVMCLGGKKADDYIGLIAQSLKKDVKHILTGGGLALAILKSRGANIGRANEAFLQSNISVDEVIKKLQQLDRDHPGALIVPEDFLIAEVETNDEEGWVVKQHRNVPAERLADPKNTNLAVFDIGKATTERYVAEFINSAKTVLLKGPLGAADMHEIFENGTRMVWGGASEKARNGELFLFGGGGESGSIIEKWHLFLSHRTLGGGSTLEGLEKGLHALPGVVRLKASASRGIPAELVNDEIEAPTPGAQAAVGRPLTDAEIPIADSVIHKMFAKPRIKSGKTKLIPFDQARKGFAFGRHEGLLDAREKAGLPVDVNNPHPGTGGKGLMQAHIDAFLYDNLTEAERLIVANHELAHLDIANGFPRGSNPNNTTYRAYIAAITKALNANARLDQKKFQEDFVNSLPDCDTTPIAEKFEALLKIRAKAKAALANLEADKVTMANLEAVVSMDETLQRGDEGVRRIFQQIAQDYGNRKIGVFAKDYLHHRAQLDAISKIREIPTKEGSGFGAYIFVSSTQVNADYWQDRFEKGRGSVLPKDAIILSVSEHNWQDPKGASNGFGTFNGWKRAIKKYASMKGVTEAKAAKELMEICKKKGIVMMHMAGKATRMQTVAMDNKSAVRLPGTVMINGKPETPTIGEAVIMNFGLNVRPGRLTLAWGDQINIPSTDISSPNTHLAEIFGVTVPIEGREDFLPQKGLLASTGRGTDVHQREKLLIEEIKQRAAQFGRKDAEMSLGFNSFRWELLQAALNEFKPELTNEGNTTTSLMTSLNIDPEFWGPFTSTEGEYIAFMKNKKPDTMSKSAWEEQVKKHWTRVRKIFKSADRLSGGNFVVFDKNDPERRGIMQGISYGIALSKVPEITNTSEWWDAGLLKEYFDSLSILLRQPKDYREEWQAERLRRFLNLPRRDQWTSTSELGQTSVNNSLVLNSSVKKGRIVNSIVIGTTAEELNIKNAIVIGSTVYKLTAKGHNVITNLVSDFGEETTLEQDEILACHYHPDRGQLRMFESFANDIGKDYKKVIQVGNHPANPLSAEEVSNILKPLPVEKRLAEKKLAIARYKTPISVRRNMAPEWAAARDKYVYSQEEFPMALLGTSGERGTHQKQLTDVRIITMQKGNLSMLAQRYGVRPGEAIVFAGDLRPSTPRLAKDALIASLQDKFKVNWQGFVSTPTVVFWATTNGTPMVSIMVTASHNPVRAENETVEDMPSQFENNGLKLNSPHGEIYKEDEPWLVEHIKEAELMQCTVPWEEDICGRDGKLKAEGLSSDQQELVNLVEQIFANPGNEAREAYRLRNTTLGFGANAFNGEHIGFNEHTGVSRDELPLIMREVGLNTHTYGRSYWEERMDTEDLEANIEKHMKDEAARLKGEGIDVISHASTDGDADRPALFDSNGNFIYGDKICGLSCIFLRELFPQKDFTAVVTATCSEAMVKLLREKYGMKVIKVEVGSPFVVSEMEKQEKLNPDSIVVGFERNTGFFMQTPIKLPNGNTIQKLATRDATFVILSVNLLAKKRNLKTLESLVDSEYNDVYESYSWSGGIASSTPGCEAYTAPMGKAIMRSLSPRDRNMLVIEFDADGEVYYTTRPEYYGMAQSKGHNMAGAEVKDRMKNIQTYLSGVFTSKRGFGSIVKMEFIDGVRIFFDNGEITHLRPSGNEPKWRIYPESGKEKGKRARAISDMRLELYPQMIADYLKKIGTGAKKRIAPRSIEGIKVSLKKLLPS